MAQISSIPSNVADHGRQDVGRRVLLCGVTAFLVGKTLAESA